MPSTISLLFREMNPNMRVWGVCMYTQAYTLARAFLTNSDVELYGFEKTIVVIVQNEFTFSFDEKMFSGILIEFDRVRKTFFYGEI